MEHTLTDKLISVLKARDIPAKREVIESAFEDDRNAQWASERLRPDTLLSKDELALYVSFVAPPPPKLQDITNLRQIPQA